MSFLQSVLSDLREKRLWPVAVGLLAAVAAVPVLLSSKTSNPTVAQPPLGAATAPHASALPAVNVVTTPAPGRLTGRARDPFSLQSPPHAAATGAASSPASTTDAVPAGAVAHNPTPASAGTVSGSSAAGTPATTTQPGQVRYLFYTTDVLFAKVGAPVRAYNNVPRVAPFPSAANPLLVFLGVNRGAKAAVFMVSSLVSLAGSGTCMPSPNQCFFLKLRPGEHETLRAPDVQGTPTAYNVRVAAIHVRWTGSFAQARAARARRSQAGDQIVAGARKHLPLLWALSYSLGTGLLSTPASWDAATHVER